MGFVRGFYGFSTGYLRVDFCGYFLWVKTRVLWVKSLVLRGEGFDLLFSGPGLINLSWAR